MKKLTIPEAINECVDESIWFWSEHIVKLKQQKEAAIKKFDEDIEKAKKSLVKAKAAKDCDHSDYKGTGGHFFSGFECNKCGFGYED